MLIGIDASRAFVPEPTGTEAYSLGIISAILKAGSADHFRLYTRSEPPPGFATLQTNCEIRAIPFPRLWTHLRLSTEMARHPPDVLFVPAHVLPLVHPRRSVPTVHDLGYLYFPQMHPAADRLYLDLSTRWNVQSASCIVADSFATKRDLIRRYHASESRIRVVYPFLRESFLRRRPSAGEIEDAKNRYAIGDDYLIAVGTIHPRKNYERLIRAFQASSGGCSLVIIGKKGWLSREILALVEKLGLSGRVKLLDYVPETDLVNLYSGARLCVFPSLYEGFGFPILESQVCGVPVACSNTSSLPEVAGDGAEFFDPLDVGAISQAISRVLLDRARQEELAVKGSANLKRFDWDAAAREFLSIFSSL